MNSKFPIGKLSEVIVAIIFVFAAFFLFFKSQYGLGVTLLVCLLILLKLEALQKIIFHPKDGFTAEFTLREILKKEDNLYVNVQDEIKVTESVSNQIEVEEYVAQITQVGGTNSHLYTRIAWQPEEGGVYLNPAEQWIRVGFNRGGNVMWLICKEGYKIESFSSPSGNQILSDSLDIGFCGIVLEDKLKNELAIVCSKKK